MQVRYQTAPHPDAGQHITGPHTQQAARFAQSPTPVVAAKPMILGKVAADQEVVDAWAAKKRVVLGRIRTAGVADRGFAGQTSSSYKRVIGLIRP